jgi:hypothetical protein
MCRCCATGSGNVAGIYRPTPSVAGHQNYARLPTYTTRGSRQLAECHALRAITTLFADPYRGWVATVSSSHLAPRHHSQDYEICVKVKYSPPKRTSLHLHFLPTAKRPRYCSQKSWTVRGPLQNCPIAVRHSQYINTSNIPAKPAPNPTRTRIKTLPSLPFANTGPKKTYFNPALSQK